MGEGYSLEELQMYEGLSLFPVLQHWMRQTVVPSGSHAEAPEAVFALLDFIELLYYQARVNVTLRNSHLQSLGFCAWQSRPSAQTG